MARARSSSGIAICAACSAKTSTLVRTSSRQPSAYDAVESVALLEGIVDIFMPDFRYWSDERSKVYLKAADYPRAARAAIQAMHAQVGVAIEKSIPPQINAHSEICDSSLRAPAMRSRMRTSAAPHRNAEVVSPPVIGTWR